MHGALLEPSVLSRLPKNPARNDTVLFGAAAAPCGAEKRAVAVSPSPDAEPASVVTRSRCAEA